MTPAPLPGGPPKPYVSRLIRGRCLWDAPAGTCGADLEAMLQTDPFAHGDLEDMMAAAEEPGGLAAQYFAGSDYRVPLDFAPDRVSAPPWMGELKVRGKGGGWRLYVGEPVNQPGLVVPVALGFKANGDAKAVDKQRDQIRKAMGLLKYHFREHGYTWRAFYD